MDKAKTKKLWVAFIALLAALAMCFTLTACGGQSDEELIKQAVDDEMSIVVDPSEETISMLADEAASGAGGALDTMGIDSTELVTSWLDGFSYSVGTITVDGDTATAEVTITCKQLGPVMTEWEATFEDNVASQGFTTMDEIYSYAGQTIMEQLNNASPTETTVTLDVIKDGGDWVVDAGSANQAVMVDAMVGEY